MARLQMYMTVGRVSEVEASITNMVFQHVVTDMPGDKLVTVRLQQCPQLPKTK